jgi:nucleotide-binding universal stress UspA family protein
VAKLADALDLGSSGVTHVGSIPIIRTKRPVITGRFLLPACLWHIVCFKQKAYCKKFFMKNILVATDFSHTAQNAANFAVKFAHALHANLLLIHVYMPPVPPGDFQYAAIPAYDIDMQAENKKMLDEEAKRLASIKANIKIEKLLQSGIPSNEIAAVAKAQNCDFVIAGTNGETNTIDKLIGSTASAIARTSEKPVLIIPQHCDYQQIKKIVFAADYSAHNNASSLQIIKNLTADLSAELMVLHILKPGYELNVEEVAGKKKVEDAFSFLPNSFKTVIHDNVEEGIHEFLKNNTAHLLVMVAHKHSFFERLFNATHTKQILYKTNLPLLILHS